MTKIVGVVVVGLLGSAGCGGEDDGSLAPERIDCAAYIDRQIDCGIIPPENAAALRDANIGICNRWEETYKAEVLIALDACAALDCSAVLMCAQEANQLCQSDVSASIAGVCEKAVECQWEGLTAQQECESELVANQGLYMCLRPDALEDYVACVQSISCGPESVDAWYACGAEHIQ